MGGKPLRRGSEQVASTGKRPAVQANEQEWRRLGELLQLRRSELGYQFRPAFVEARGINIRRVSDIENNYRPNTFPPGSLREIAQAYQVTYDSIGALLRGEADELIPAEPAPPRASSAPTAPVGDSRATPMVTGEDDVTASWSYAEPIWERLYDLARAGNLDPTGADLFGEGTDDARTWDDPRLRRLLPLRERVRNIADLRRREAGPRNTPLGQNSPAALLPQWPAQMPLSAPTPLLRPTSRPFISQYGSTRQRKAA
jgi:hypothetical protein